MRKISPHISESVDYITVYRDQLEDMYNIMCQASNEVLVAVDDYILDSWEDLEKIRTTEIDEFCLRILDPHISISLKKDGAYVFSEGDISAQGVALRIINILKKRKNRFMEFADRQSMFLGVSFFTLAIGLSLLGLLDKQFSSIVGQNVVYPLLIFGFIPLLIGLFVTVTKLNKSRYFLCYEKNNPSFLKRNKDEIIRDLIIGLLLVFFGAIIGRLI